MNIVYSPEAIKDLVRLREFIAIKNPSAAKQMAQSLQLSIQQLKQFPLMGKAVDLAPEPEQIRDLISANYTVRYLIGSEVIYILRVWHQREDR